MAAFRQALPDANLFAGQPGDPPRPADYAVVWRPPQAFVDAHPGLRAVFNIGAGVDALVGLRLPPGMPMVRVEDAGMGVQMAEYVTHAVIRHYRGLDAFAADQAAGRWTDRDPLPREDFPVGVLGLGVLGARVARAVAAFEFPVVGWSRTPHQLAGVRSYAGAEGFDEFLAATRILVCLLPLTPETEGILNRRTLSKLRPGGYLINVARGAHLVEDDLVALLDEGRLAGATLDVFRTEPLPAAHAFWRHPRITVTPHTSARSLVHECVAQIAGKIHALGRGEPVTGVVDRARGY
ncbi:MAG: glyoxylate/hydroxypyruvate reductase A [Burkholderiaceae bacterium]|nr:glyoxylate/hydroxypyruvate reductase A [Burkholderiaceae bacterium]